MNYPIDLIKAYKSGEISRAVLTAKLSKRQGFDGAVKGHADHSGVYITYRGRVAKIEGNLLVWQENYLQQEARSVKEMKIKIDIAEMRAAAVWTNY